MSEKTTPKTDITRSRLLALLHFLLENTDDEYHASTDEIIQALAVRGYKADLKILKADVAALNAADYDVHTELENRSDRFWICARAFELPELRMLVDAVNSSQFISPRRSSKMMKKLAALTNVQHRKELTANIYTGRLTKTHNNSVYRNIALIGSAISQDRKLTFQYWNYNVRKEKVLRHNGKWYVISPYSMIWKDDRYYLVGWSDERNDITTFRIDRIKTVKITEEPRYLLRGFKPDQYADSSVKMYGVGKETDVTLHCGGARMDSVIDRFGFDVPVEVLEDGSFNTTVRVRPNNTFFGWVFQYSDIQITGPSDVVKAYQEKLADTLKLAQM